MGIITGQAVPKDRRTNGEISPNSGTTASKADDSGGLPSATDGAGGALWFDRYVLDLERGCLMAGDEEVNLRPKSFELLRYLASNPGRLVSKDELLAAVWPNVVVTDDSLVQCVVELRRALLDQDQRLIRTLPRRGYRFEASPTLEPPRPALQVAAAPVESVRIDESTWRWQRSGGTIMKRRASMLVALCVLGTIATVIGMGWWFGLDGRPTPAPPLSIVVLPFENFSDDPDQEYFADGVSSDLTTELSRLPGMFVIAHATARTLEGRSVDPVQIGRELNVRYLLDGRVRRSGTQLRINVELVDAADGASVWAERFERERDQLHAWQDEVIGRIAMALNYRLTRLEGERALRERGDDPEADDLTTRGWALIYTAKRPDTYDAARALFQRALEQDPRAVDAIVGIGWTSAVSVLDGWSAAPAQDLAAAETAVAQALALDPQHFVAHHVRGFVFRLKRRSQAAHDAFQTAVALNPNFASGYAQLGVTALELGRPEETVPAVERAIRLSPRDPNLGPWLAIAGTAELHLGHYDEAAVWLTRAIDTGTPVARHHAYLAAAFALAGRADEAQAALAQFRQMKPAATIARLRAQARSTEPGFVAQQEPFYEGLRLAGLPE